VGAVTVVVTGDLHYDPTGQLTTPARVERLVQRIRVARPHVVAIAGDVGHGLRAFRDGLACFRGLGVPVGVVAGNHDVWRDPEGAHGSEKLWGGLLEEVARGQGAVWLERETLRVGDVAVVGSMTWYDYSAVAPGCGLTPDQVGALKPRYSNDSRWLDWDREDRALARELADGLVARLRAAAGDPGVRAVVVVTHVPVLEQQVERRPEWAVSNAYFGNLTVGREVLREPKVRFVVSAHTHAGRRSLVARPGAPPVEALVVGSDYGSPGHVKLVV
jgi:predicted phosphohydrolase